MKIQPVSDIGLETTRLGFGCSALLGPRSEEEALQLLSTAYNAGIRHFDTAPIYGYGEAEKVLGTFLQGRREQVTVTTKFGIEPGLKFPGHRFVLGAVRKAMRVVQPIRRLVKRQAGRVMQGGGFDPTKARESLDTSLQKLGTDYVDVFMLHDCSAADVTDDLVIFLEKAIRRGKVRFCGLGTSKNEIDQIVERFPGVFKVLQYRYEDYEAPVTGKLVINHGVFINIKRIYNKIKGTENNEKMWREHVPGLTLDMGSIANLMIAKAYRDKNNGIILFSSTSEKNIVSNVLSAHNFSPPTTALSGFKVLLKSIGGK